MTKKHLMAAPLLGAVLVVAGCSGDPAATGTVASDTTDAATAAADAAAVDCPAPAYSATPPDVSEVESQYFVRTDRVYVTKAGDERRRTTIELMEGDPGAVAQAIVDGYVARGFRQLEVADEGDGTSRFAVTKAGVGRTNISATTDRGNNPSHPRSVGLVHFDWPVTVPKDTSDNADTGETGATAGEAGEDVAG